MSGVTSVDRLALNDELAALLAGFGWESATSDGVDLDELTHTVADWIEARLTVPDDDVMIDDITDWKYEVANGDTVLGLKEWVEHRDEADRISPQNEERHPTHDDDSRQAWDNDLPLP